MKCEWRWSLKGISHVSDYLPPIEQFFRCSEQKISEILVEMQTLNLKESRQKYV